MSIEIPDKLYFKIGEVSKLAHVAPHVVRYWEGEFKEIQPKRTNSNQRLYRRNDVEIVLLIKQLLHDQGFTLTGAKKFLTDKQQAGITEEQAACKQDHLSTIKEELLAVKILLNGKK